ncbi:hypothetical protein [Paenibacillus silvestris]|uniref:hypothetical protein n=1 Tax=Paenibacillus silvestris TaxID=2606219 RepID=UPI001372EF49|nr:hypothetical protein [Paenibacillus silvestris]
MFISGNGKSEIILLYFLQLVLCCWMGHLFLGSETLTSGISLFCDVNFYPAHFPHVSGENNVTAHFDRGCSSHAIDVKKKEAGSSIQASF